MSAYHKGKISSSSPVHCGGKRKGNVFMLMTGTSVKSSGRASGAVATPCDCYCHCYYYKLQGEDDGFFKTI